jgi:hypothetical protein
MSFVDAWLLTAPGLLSACWVVGWLNREELFEPYEDSLARWLRYSAISLTLSLVLAAFVASISMAVGL